MKKCTKCGRELPEDMFSKDVSRKDGLQCWCKNCRYLVRKKWRETHMDEVGERNKKWRETHKEEITLYNRQYYCEHKKEYAEYRREHSVKIKEYARRYSQTERGKASYKAATHKRRIAVLNNGGTFSADEWLNVCITFNNQCAYCGKKIKLTADHIIPISKGGSSNIGNIIPVCHSCNSSKCANDLGDWYPKQPFFSQERYDKIIDYMLSHKQEER